MYESPVRVTAAYRVPVRITPEAGGDRLDIGLLEREVWVSVQGANAAERNDYYHSVANPAEGEEPGERTTPPLVTNKGYRPHRKSQRRRAK